MKKLLVGVVAVIAVSLFSVQSFAMTENEFIQYMKDKNFADEYIVYAQNQLKTDDFTSAQLEDAKAYVDKSLEVVMPKNPEVITKGKDYFKKDLFTKAENDQVLDNVVKAANSLDMKAVVKTGPDNIRYIEFYSQEGKKLGSIQPKKDTLKLTGVAISPVMVYGGILLLFLIVLILGTVFVRKSYFKKKVC